MLLYFLLAITCAYQAFAMNRLVQTTRGLSSYGLTVTQTETLVIILAKFRFCLVFLTSIFVFLFVYDSLFMSQEPMTQQHDQPSVLKETLRNIEDMVSDVSWTQ